MEDTLHVYLNVALAVIVLPVADVSNALAESPVLRGVVAAALVGPLQNQKAIRGCSWSVSVPTHRGPHYLLAEIDESVVWMNIDGKDIRLRVKDSNGGAMSKVGDTSKRVYESTDIRVDATYTVMWACPPQSEGGCEVTKFAATLRVQKGVRIQTVQGYGEVGC